VLQLLVEELTGQPFAAWMQAEVLGPLGMTASSFQWRRTAATASPHDADGARMPDFTFAERAAAGLVTTAADLARFLAATVPGPHGEPARCWSLGRAGRPAGARDRRARQADPRVQALMALPGVGRLTAMTLVAEIGDIARFPTGHKPVTRDGEPGLPTCSPLDGLRLSLRLTAAWRLPG